MHTDHDLKLLDELGHGYNYAVVSTWYCGNRYIDCLSTYESPCLACIGVAAITEAAMYRQTIDGWEVVE